METEKRLGIQDRPGAFSGNAAAYKQLTDIHNSAEMTLEQVLAVIQTAEAAGKTTVRFHTGDPSIYDAVWEQFDALEN